MSQGIVDTIKAQLEARGVDLRGPCGAFEITSRVAWEVRGEGWGLHAKESGNQCQGYSVDVLIHPSGKYVDILQDAGGANGPSWQLHEGGDVTKWRPPFEVDTPPTPPPNPPPNPDPPALDLVAWLTRIEGKVDGLGAPHKHPRLRGRFLGVPLVLEPEE